MHKFTEQAKAKGWTNKAIGERWGLKPRQMSNIAKSPPQKYLDALNGLPNRKEANIVEYYTSDMAGSGQFGTCAKCMKGPTKEGHDGCLGTLSGNIMNACCGHGNDRMAYIQYWGKNGEGGKIIEGDEAINEQIRLLKNAPEN